MTTSRHSSTPLSATKTLLLAASAMSCALAATPTMAQTVLGTIIVQADRSPLQREQVGRSLTVITSEQIETMKAAYVTDVLRQVPGVAVAGFAAAIPHTPWS
jgi:vitamin B12 transporter